MAQNPRSIAKQQLINQLWHKPKNYFLSLKSGHPGKKLKLIGVTGTDGKTSTCVLLYHILKNAGFRVGLISTIGARLDSDWIDTQLHMTSPDPKLIQALLVKMLAAKLDYVVLEVTSIALDQYRFLGCSFDIGVFLNLATEHLDYHKTMDNYLLAKSKLLTQAQYATANGDDPVYFKLKQLVPKNITTFGTGASNNIRAKSISLGQSTLEFTVNGNRFVTNSNYEYQIYNILAALSVARHLEIPDQVVISTILNYPETKGRREEITNELGIKCLVDYGHTPQALLATFSSLKKTNPQASLISVFGATGGRDQSKRPQMGEIAAKYCTLTILTSDDTRQENVRAINSQIISGMNNKADVFVLAKNIPSKSEVKEIRTILNSRHLYIEVDNRQDAITTALLVAQEGDIVCALGIGHQKTILIGTTEYPWSENDAFRTALNTKMTLAI